MITTSLLTLFLLISGKSYAAGNAPVVVAVIDTGADIHHPALKQKLWRNPGELGVDSKGRDKSSNGIDDDGNGFIDDVNGWNFIQHSADIQDHVGHGTHIAGIISQSPETQVMVLHAVDTNLNGEQAVSASVQAIEYAIQNHAQIINYSAGGAVPSQEEQLALLKAEKNHILVIAAAGNEKSNMDTNRFYPAGYALKNILSVAAVDIMGKLLPSSNFGMKTVQIAAQGQRILSALPGDKYGAMSGTSQATAMVTQAAALYCSQHPKCRPQDTIAHLISTSDHSRLLDGKIGNPVVLNTMRVAQDRN